MSEGVAVGSTIARVHATDPDHALNGLVHYALADYTDAAYGTQFAINNATGELWVRAPLDHEAQGTYQLTVTAADRGPGSMAASRQGVQSAMLDENDNSPVITHNSLTPSKQVEVWTKNWEVV